MLLLPLFLLLLSSLLEASPPVRPNTVACSQGTYGCNPLVPRPRLPDRRTNALHRSAGHDCVPRAPSQRLFGTHLVPTAHGEHHKSQFLHVTHAWGSGSDVCITPESDEALSPINRMKQCMDLKDLDCFRTVLDSFDRLSPQIRQICLAQIPALAAQSFAVHIWSYMNVHQSDFRYPLWDERAFTLYKHHMNDAESAGLVVGNDRTYGYRTLWLWRLQDLRSPEVKYSDLLKQLISPQEFRDSFFGVKLQSVPEQAVALMMSAFTGHRAPTVPPTIFNIIKALEIKDQEKRRHELDNLQKLIHKVLLERIFLLDDMIGSANFMFMLVWKFGDNEDEHIQSFLHNLLRLGAPISELNIFLNYVDMLAWKDYPEKAQDLAKYERVAAKMISYCSGDPVKSLSGILRTFAIRKEEPDVSILKVLQAYKQIFPEADLNSPPIVESLDRYISALVSENDLLLVFKTVDSFVENGLSAGQVNLSSIDGVKSLCALLDKLKFHKDETFRENLSLYTERLPDFSLKSPSIITYLAAYVWRLRLTHNPEIQVKEAARAIFTYGLRAKDVTALYLEFAKKPGHSRGLQMALGRLSMELAHQEEKLERASLESKD